MRMYYHFVSLFEKHANATQRKHGICSIQKFMDQAGAEWVFLGEKAAYVRDV